MRCDGKHQSQVCSQFHITVTEKGRISKTRCNISEMIRLVLFAFLSLQLSSPIFVSLAGLSLHSLCMQFFSLSVAYLLNSTVGTSCHLFLCWLGFTLVVWPMDNFSLCAFRDLQWRPVIRSSVSICGMYWGTVCRYLALILENFRFNKASALFGFTKQQHMRVAAGVRVS